MSDVMNIQDILYYLPHRYPFLLLDRVLSYELGKSLVAVKNVTYNEPFFEGHFPNLPIMPGVLILEAFGQAAGILAYKTANVVLNEDRLSYLAGIDAARFRRVVVPGDQLRIEVKVIRHKQDIWKSAATAHVDGELVASAEVMIAHRTKSGMKGEGSA